MDQPAADNLSSRRVDTCHSPFVHFKFRPQVGLALERPGRRAVIVKVGEHLVSVER